MHRWWAGYGNGHREMTRIILVRHGQTEWNRIERFRGRATLDLNEVGIKQAEAIAKRIVQWSVVAVYSSSLLRAVTTAQILAQHLGLEVECLPGLIDIDYGEWQGLSPDEAAVRDSSLYRLWLESPHLVTFPGGESLTQVRERAVACVDNLIQVHPEKTMVVVSHKVVCQVLILHFLGLDNSCFWRVTQDVSAINLFEIRGGIPVALLLNDTCHLSKLSLS